MYKAYRKRDKEREREIWRSLSVAANLPRKLNSVAKDEKKRVKKRGEVIPGNGFCTRDW